MRSTDPTDGGDTGGRGNQHNSGNLNGSVNATRLQVTLDQLYCTRTTDEHDHDEIYYAFGGVNGKGEKSSGRGPSAYQGADADNATAWDMNDSGDKQFRQLNATILDEPLAPGQSARFSFGFLESDGTDLSAVVKAAGELATLVGKGNVYAAAGGIALKTIGQYVPSNQDDSLGGFTLQVQNDGGKVSVPKLELEPYTTYHRDLDPATGSFSLRFLHDRGDYIANCRILGV